VQIQRLEGARFRVIFHSPVTADDAAAPEDQQILQMTGKLNALFEDWIRERPHEWMCTKRRWPKHLMKPNWAGKAE
jgi:KDO2-lipid IV(A) lauroyltransferase